MVFLDGNSCHLKKRFEKKSESMGVSEIQGGFLLSPGIRRLVSVDRASQVVQ